jgi:hypothetical protein
MSKVTWASAATVTAIIIAGCSSPKPLDLSAAQDQSLADAIATITEIDEKLTVTTVPDIDPSSDGAEQWFVTAIKPEGDIASGDTIELVLESALSRAKGACFAGVVEDDGATLILDMLGGDPGSGIYGYSDIECVLKELDVPASVLTSMNSTRALDGRQRGDWDGINAEWSFHPDDGLDVILTLED